MLPQETVQHIENALRGLQYGSIQLIVHDAHIVRIERIERTRLTVTSEALSQHAGRPTSTMEVRCDET